MIFDEIFELLGHTRGIEQGAEHHPEGDVYTHSLQCVAHAFRESIDIDLILAALCHDFGKAIETNGHERHSVALCGEYLSAKSLWLIEHHLRVRYLYDGRIKKLTKAHYLLYHPWLPDLVHLSRLDKLGRNPNTKRLLTREQIIEKLDICVENHFLVNGSYKARQRRQL